MGRRSGFYASALRRDLAARNRDWARRWPHVQSYGDDPVVVYAPLNGLHGNFCESAYRAIAERPDWRKRLEKVHAQGRSLPQWTEDPKRKWCELDSCMSSDALLMNVFCAAGVNDSPPIRRMLGIHAQSLPEFGWKARVPLKSQPAPPEVRKAIQPKSRFDRTEVDMRWGDLLVEAKLTEADFQTRKAGVVHAYHDFDKVFDPTLLPQTEVLLNRRRSAEEFHEAYTQEWEDTSGMSASHVRGVGGAFRSGLVAEAKGIAPREIHYEGYQLIRNVLAAYATGARFCVLCDRRRPDLIEVWLAVMGAVRTAHLRTRLQVLTWQELASALPLDQQEFLEAKYGIIGS